jgi:hypothetical protein
MRNKMATSRIINNSTFYRKAATLFKTISRSEGSTTKPSHNRTTLTNWLKEEAVGVYPVMPRLTSKPETKCNCNNKINKGFLIN